MKIAWIRYSVVIISLIIMTTTGCAIKRPTIAHVHVGHALTGWHDTPGKEGLFVTAEKEARKALDAARAANQGNPQATRQFSQIQEVINATDGATGKKHYGVKQALTGAMNHITYAAASEDASPNVRQFAGRFEHYTQFILDRSDLITALGKDVLGASSREERNLLTGEIVKLTAANLYGEDADGDGVPGGQPSEYGLKQLRSHLETMLKRENPPYKSVNTWYLFNLIRLPDGSWIFRNRFQDQDTAYGRGGGNGGGDGGGGGY
jgi:hypothetical protein